MNDARRAANGRRARGISSTIGALLLVLAVGLPSAGSGAGTHAVIGGALGYAWSESPIVAFLVGFASHALLDVMPHHDPDPGDGPDIALFCAFNIGTLFATMELYRACDRDPRFLWGAIGGALPDLEHLIFYKACKGFDLCEAKLYPTHDGTLPHLGGAPMLVGYPLELGACLLAIRIAF